MIRDSMHHKMFAKMPHKDSTTIRPRRSPRFLRQDTLSQEPTPLSLRRSPRLSRLAQERQASPDRPLSSSKKSRKCRSAETVSKESRKPSEGFGRSGNLSTGSKKSRGLAERVEGFRNLRRSSRISPQCRETSASECSGAEGSPNPRLPSEEEGSGNSAARETERENMGNAFSDSKAIAERGDWTEEQELALRRAYLAAKPTPSFWKKVSRLVPGKSAKDCFDKLNSGYATPPQREQVSRAKRKNASPILHFRLSASKVLKPNESKAKKPISAKQKRHIAHKNARLLLKEHYRNNQVHEADLFSVLEANTDLPTEPYQLSTTLSTPKNLHQKFIERSISGCKRPVSRFFRSGEKALVSPPVLKQVKNPVLHERYIDQLHSRDAKRKTESKQHGKPSLNTADGKENQIPKLDLVRAAKNALVSDAREAITALQQIQSDPTSNSSDWDDDFFKSDADESEMEM